MGLVWTAGRAIGRAGDLVKTPSAHLPDRIKLWNIYIKMASSAYSTCVSSYYSYSD